MNKLLFSSVSESLFSSELTSVSLSVVDRKLIIPCVSDFNPDFNKTFTTTFQE